MSRRLGPEGRRRAHSGEVRQGKNIGKARKALFQRVVGKRYKKPAGGRKRVGCSGKECEIGHQQKIGGGG